MRQFVHEGEQLRRLRVNAVDEDQGCERIGERESSELRRVKPAVRVGTHHAIDHDEDADVLNAVDQATPSLPFVGERLTLLNTEVEPSSDV